MPRHEFVSARRRSVAARPPGAGLGRSLPARGRLGPLCLALLCALPVSPGAVEHVPREEVKREETNNEQVILENNQRLVVSPGVTIEPKNLAGGNRNFAVSGGTDVGLDNKGTIGALNAFEVNSIFEVLNSGTISGSSGSTTRSNARTHGIRAKAGNITKLVNNTGGSIRAQYAVSATGHIGTLTNEGTIFGVSITPNVTGAGVEAGSIGTLTNRKQLEGTYRAILVYGHINELNNEEDGRISSRFGDDLFRGRLEEADAIVFGSIGTLTNAGSITANTVNTSPRSSAALKGLNANSTIGTLTNEATGTITGLAAAIEVGAITTQLTNRGTIQGGTGEAAIHLTSSSIASGTLTNYKTIKGGAQGLLSVSPITELSNEKDALIEGDTGAGVDVRRITTLNNRGGTITSTSSDGVKALSIGTLNNSDGGKISGTSAGSHGIAAGSIGTLNNSSGGEISGAMSGVQADSIDNLSNAANSTISGGAQGVKAGTITKLVNNKGGAISGGEAGVEGDTIVELVNEKGGTISGDNHGVLARSRLGTLQNSGTISGGQNGITASAIDLLDNSGLISGGRNGIQAAFIQTLSNQGTIRGSAGAGLSLGSGGRLENSGLITGGARAHGILARGAIDLLQNRGGGIIEGQTGVEINPTRAGQTTIDNAGILRSLDGPPGVALAFRGRQGRDRLILRDDFSLEGNILWDGLGDTLQYLSARPALLTFTDNDAPALTEPTRFDVDAGGRPFLRGTRRSAQAGQAETIIAILDPTLYTLGDAALSQWTGAIFQGLDRLPGPGAERPGPNRRHKTGPLDHVLWARPFGGLHRFKQDGPFVPPARHRFAGGLAGFSALGQRAGGGLFMGAAQSVIEVSGPARDEDSEHIFTGVWAGARIAEFDLDAAVLVGRGRYRSEWQRANNRAPGGRERVWSKYTGLFVSPELGLATRFEVKGVALRPSLRLRYLGLFASAHDYQTEASPFASQAGGGQTALRIKARGLHIGLARAGLGFPLSFAANAHGGQLAGELRLGAEGRVRLSGDTVSATLGGQNVEFKAGGGKAITGFAGASFDYAVPALNLTFSADVETRYGSMTDLGIHGQLGFMWAF